MLKLTTETSDSTTIFGLLDREQIHRDVTWYLPDFLCFPLDWLFFVHTSAIKIPVEGSIPILPKGFHPQTICIQSLKGGVGTLHFLNHV